MSISVALGLFAACAWVAVLILPSRPYSIRERIEASADRDSDLSAVSVIIPARNESAHLRRTIASLASQGRGLQVFVVDDASTDPTREVATDAAREFRDSLALHVVDGSPLPSGWSGKLWALEQGLQQTERPWVLLLDADIEIASGLIAALLTKAHATASALVSVMATLRCTSFWERLLVPPFIFFFKLIYPFAHVNDTRSGVAAAAGGCILIKASVLRDVGAFGSIRGALIDDCSLARAVKGAGNRLWLGLSGSVKSHRGYDQYRVFARMIARTAFTQLRNSTLLLLGVTILMVGVFAGPLIALWNNLDMLGVIIMMLGFLAMCAAYVPILRFYSLPTWWAITLPVAALLYLAMTWQSALIYWGGTRASWKDRNYAVR